MCIAIVGGHYGSAPSTCYGIKNARILLWEVLEEVVGPPSAVVFLAGAAL